MTNQQNSGPREAHENDARVNNEPGRPENQEKPQKSPAQNDNSDNPNDPDYEEKQPYADNQTNRS